jgi:hypothetical protein
MICKFLRLEDKILWIDQEDYFIKEIGKLQPIEGKGSTRKVG